MKLWRSTVGMIGIASTIGLLFNSPPGLDFWGATDGRILEPFNAKYSYEMRFT